MTAVQEGRLIYIRGCGTLCREDVLGVLGTVHYDCMCGVVHWRVLPTCTCNPGGIGSAWEHRQGPSCSPPTVVVERWVVDRACTLR